MHFSWRSNMSTVRFNAVIGPDQLIRPPAGIQLEIGQAEVIVVQCPEPEKAEQPIGSLRDRLARAAADLGIEGLPSDLAENHDHYAHGSPKGIDRP